MSNICDIEIRYLPHSPLLNLTEEGDWCDLYCYEDTVLKAGEMKCISMGVAMKLPEGFEAWMVPRSSTFKRWGILQANGIGIIDNSYCGNDDIWLFPALATRDVTIPAGTRICQFRIMPNQPKLNFILCDKLNAKNRDGFGSTGI